MLWFNILLPFLVRSFFNDMNATEFYLLAGNLPLLPMLPGEFVPNGPCNGKSLELRRSTDTDYYLTYNFKFKGSDSLFFSYYYFLHLIPTPIIKAADLNFVLYLEVLECKFKVYLVRFLYSSL